MSIILYFSLTVLVIAAIYFTYKCISDFYYHDTNIRINDKYTDFSLPRFDSISDKKEVSEEYVLLTEQNNNYNIT